ncbi:MAG: hypothetical protein P3M72_00060 [Candidatus Hodgkinia cicadicola]|nr:MAG: hypothetical protein P3M72_00060 [Candidatus Hodgkinia cicadicola]
MACACKAITEISKREATKRLKEDELVEGLVAHKNSEFMTVVIGYKAGAKLYSESMWNYGAFEIGSKIQVYIEQVEAQANETLISRRQLDIEAAWEALTEAQSENNLVEGLIQARVKEGYAVKVCGLVALLPYSLIDKRSWLQLATGLETTFGVAEADKTQGLIVLSKTLDGAEDDMPQPGCVVWGIINDITDDGMKIDLGWDEGLIPLDNIPWQDLIKLLSGSVVGQLIKTVHEGIDSKLENVMLSIENMTTVEAEDEQEPAFGSIAKITEDELIVHTLEDITTFASAAAFGANSMREYMAEEGLEVGDVVQTLPIEVDCVNKLALIDVDIDSAKCFRFVTLNAENSVMGLVADLNKLTLKIALEDDVFGELEMDTEELAKEAFGLWKNQTIELVVSDYDPKLNIIYLEIASDDRIRSTLVEAQACPCAPALLSQPQLLPEVQQ